MSKTALYFPRIEVEDVSWLLGAVLFWDQISTITPDESNPYSSPVAVELAAEGVLLPHRMSPDSEAAAAVVDGIEDLLTSPNVDEVLRGDDGWATGPRSLVSRRKITDNLQYSMKQLFGPGLEVGDNLALPSGLAAAYMLSLATEVASLSGADLVTDSPAEFRAAEAILRPVRMSREEEPRGGVRDRAMFVDACLAEAVTRWVRVAPDTPVPKLLQFRERRSDELDQLRELLGEAADRILRNEPLSELVDVQQRAAHYVNEEVRPALAAVETALKDARVDFVPSVIESVITAQLPGAAAAMMGATWALVAAPVLALSIRGVRHFTNIHTVRRDCPYRYLLRAGGRFGDLP